MLWGIFTQPRLHAAFELFTAARTDPVLRDQLGPVMQRHRGNLQAEARRHFPEAAARGGEFEALVDTVLDALQGAALGALVNGGSADAERVLPLLERVARRELADV